MRRVLFIALLFIWALGHDPPLCIPVLSGKPAGTRRDYWPSC
jgi:hypothetical protein